MISSCASLLGSAQLLVDCIEWLVHTSIDVL